MFWKRSAAQALQNRAETLYALQKKFLELKDAFPEEKRMIIAAEEDIEFEAIINVMDTGRMIKSEGDEPRELFPEVVLSPGLS